MTEDIQEVPKWLKELEEKRERRLKARLGHEAGAGSPCLTCEEKCPGLDLHFWRKICKNCKCGKENHDVNDDDIYGWAQFQLLGSKPNKSNKFVLPGRKDAVELDWIPKGVTDAVESYLKDLPLNLLPIKGSPAAIERKQLLQKQIPLHDIDPTLCHALSENEIKQMNDYIAHVKQNSVGVGRILKLNELLIANRAPMQIPQMENIVLQGANRSQDLIQKNLQDLKLAGNKLPALAPNQHLINEDDYQNPTVMKTVQNVMYNTQQLSSSGLPTNLKNYTAMFNDNTLDYQNPCVIPNICNIQNSVYTNSSSCERENDSKYLNNNALLPNQLICNHIDNQTPLNIHTKDVEYPVSETKTFPNYTTQNANQNILDSCNRNVGHLLVPKNEVSNIIDHQHITVPNYIKDLNYPSYSQNNTILNNLTPDSNLGVDQKHTKVFENPVRETKTFSNYTGQNVNQNVLDSCNGNVGHLLVPNSEISNTIDHQHVTVPSYIKDLNYPSYSQNKTIANNTIPYSNVGVDDQNDIQIPRKPIFNQIDDRFPRNIDDIQDINYAASQNLHNSQITEGKPFHKLNDAQIPNCLTQSHIDNQNLTKSHLHDVNYPLKNLSSNLSHTEDYPNQHGKSSVGQSLPHNLQKIHNVSVHSSESVQSPYRNLQIPSGPMHNKIDQQIPVQPGNFYHVNYPVNTVQQPIVNQNLHNISNIKDLVYSTYDPQPSGNPDEINAVPTAINIGSIKDIEYPTINSVVQTQEISEPALPRKNVHFNLVPEEILPSCHKCNKMFNDTSLVIGIDRTDALWHADCFKCAGCNQNLADLMYFYDKSSDNIYCGRDYAKIRGIPRCHACDELIFVKEYCLAENSTFHVKHFCCYVCDVPLAGQNYVMEDSQPLCLLCFELLKAEKCNTCLKVIKPDEQGANLKGVHFHADDNCFVCKMCKSPLLGAKLLFKNMNLYCSASCFGADV